MKGNVLTEWNKPLLFHAREVLEKAKQTKLELRANKHNYDNWNSVDIFQHLKEEVVELSEAKTLCETLFELADISNCVDIMLMALLAESEENND